MEVNLTREETYQLFFKLTEKASKQQREVASIILNEELDVTIKYLIRAYHNEDFDVDGMFNCLQKLYEGYETCSIKKTLSLKEFVIGFELHLRKKY